VVERDKGGNPVRHTGTQFDINERVIAQEALKKAHEVLEQKVSERTAELVNTNERLKQEIKERKQVEEELRESEERYRLLADNVTDVIWTRDMNLNLTYISPSVKNQQGYTTEEAMDRTLEEIFTPDSLKLVRGVFAEELEIERSQKKDLSRSRTIEAEVKRKDGQTIWTEAKMSFLRDTDGNPSGIIGISRSITERKHAEDALRESESKFRSLFNLSPQAISLTEVKNGRLVDVNNKFCELTKRSKEELIGFTTTELGFYSKADRSKFITGLQASGRVDGLEMKFKAKDNSILHAFMFARIIQISGGSFILTIFNDVTEQKRLEDQLQQAYKMEAIGTLAGGIAHDFNNILGIILGNAELAMDDVPEWNPARFNLTEIRTASLRAKDVVRQLLSFARKTELEKKPTNIIPIIKETLKMMRSSIPTSIEFRQNIVKDVDIVLADPTQINQVLINLCTNASHAMPDGGILEVNLKNVELDEDAATQYSDLNPGRYINLMVSDTGQGISQEEIDRIFDPYFTTKEIGKGTGMGLAVVHGIVITHHGAISVDSEVGKGTSFNIFLPAVTRKPAAEPAIDEDLPTGNERILFLDDEESIVNMGRQRLERLGYKVESTTNPIEALNLFRSKPDTFDLVITDLTMPKMTGDKLVKEILNIRPDIPVIISTGFSEKINEEKTKAIGVAGYLEKPHDKGDLAITVRQVLDGK
jgi:PAS domain S-box-containing protein